MVVRSVLVITALTAILAYTVYFWGGTLPGNWYIALVAIGLTGMLYWGLPTARYGSVPPPGPRLWIPLLVFPVYLMVQIIPLPLGVLRIISPARAALATGMSPVFPIPSFVPLSVDPSATFGHFLRIAAFAIVFLLVREAVLRMPNDSWALCIPIIGIGGAGALSGILQFAADPETGYAHGAYVNRNHFASLLEMSIPFAAMYALAFYTRLRGQWSLWSLLGCAITALSTVAMFVGVLDSLSRTGFASCLASFLVMGILLSRGLSRRTNLTTASLLTMAVVVVFTMLPPERLLSRFGELTTGGGLSGRTHVEIWKETLGLIAAYPVFGCGAGAFAAAFPKYMVDMPPLNSDFAHNDYLQAIAELGIVGFAIAAVFAVSVFAGVLRTAGDESRVEIRYVSTACAGSLITILIHSFSDFSLYIPANALLAAWICGMSTAFALLGHNRRSAMQVEATLVMP